MNELSDALTERATGRRGEEEQEVKEQGKEVDKMVKKLNEV